MPAESSRQPSAPPSDLSMNEWPQDGSPTALAKYEAAKSALAEAHRELPLRRHAQADLSMD